MCGGVIKYNEKIKGESIVPNIKSAIKRVKVNEKKNAENKMIKSEISTYVRKYKNAIAEKNVEEATKLLSEVVSRLDSAASKNVIHKKG